jgi:citrate lyase beta subunit
MSDLSSKGRLGDATERLTRSMLFVPASRIDMIEKASRSAADAVCIDLEDAVAPDHKEASRANIIQALQQLDFGARVRMVRINALDTPFAYRDVIEVVEAAGQQLDLIMLPKANRPHDVQFLDTLLAQIEARSGLTRQIGVEAQIETASGFMWLREIAQSAPRLEALIFGPGDYAASMRMPLANIGEADAHDAAYPGHRWHAVMHAIVAAARTYGLRCMDGPYADFKDEAGFERACRVALALGFDGKQCIHPAQLAMANRIFSPSPDELAWARAVAAAYEQAMAEGRGAISLNGKMIDAANVRMARTILHRQQQIDARERA